MQPNQNAAQNTAQDPTQSSPENVNQSAALNFIVYSETAPLIPSTPMAKSTAPIQADSIAPPTNSAVNSADHSTTTSTDQAEPTATGKPIIISESIVIEPIAIAIETAIETATEIAAETATEIPSPIAIPQSRRGIYITANDKVMDHAIALLKSIRQYDAETPVVLIPYDDNYAAIAERLGQQFGVTLYPDLEFIDRLSRHLFEIFGRDFFARPNQFRKQACWFGEFDEFLYIDTDIVVFEKIIDNLNYLKDYDFLACDYQHLGGIKNVFTSKILEDGIFTEADLRGIFNGGWWAAKKGAVQEADLYESFSECAKHPEWFDFSQKTSDQPIINYMILKKVAKRFNIVQREGGAPGSWAGSTHFMPDGDDRLYDPTCDQALQYLHWAGIRIEPGCPYWEIWAHYRYLNEVMPKFEQPQPKKSSPLKQFVRKIKG
jgi:Mannosyltransferase putative